LVTKLKEKGVGNAHALVGGTAAWKNAGYPMESSEKK
jgi:rhodanese-related sulfurtransferase